MKCQLFDRYLFDYCDDDLSPVLREKIDKHLQECSNCSNKVKLTVLENEVLRDNSDPVSYTHLDVYKRQNWQRLEHCQRYISSSRRQVYNQIIQFPPVSLSPELINSSGQQRPSPYHLSLIHI